MSHLGLHDGVMTGLVPGLYDNPSEGFSNGVLSNEGLTNLWDYDAINFITNAKIVDPLEMVAINRLTIRLKKALLWKKLVAVYPFIGGQANTLQPTKYNLKDPRDLDSAFRLTYSGPLVAAKTGVTAAFSGYGNTHLNLSTVLTTFSNSIHLSFYSRSNSTTGTDQIDIGASVPGVSFCWLSADYSNGFDGRFLSRNTSGAVLANSANANSKGFYISSKTENASNAFKTYKNGIVQSTNTGSGSNPNNEVYIFAFNSSGPGQFSNRECAFASIGYGLTEWEAKIFNDIVNEFQFILKRNV